jgi:hypothetical protein
MLLVVRVVLAVLVLIAPGAVLAQTARPSPSPVRAAWVQMTGAGAEARAAATGSECPEAEVDGRLRLMSVRVAVTPSFPMVCSLPLSAGARSVSVGGQSLAVPARAIRRIVVLGDTGCRIQGWEVQACNDARAWPFATVARLAAAQNPDLVIHVGDYYYRTNACPPDKAAACAGSPFGDRWDTWAAEFFDPARPLLQAAPWVLARGNHESCDRGGRGWYVLLDAGPAPAGCVNLSAPFVVHAGDLNLFVIDSADAADLASSRAKTEDIASQLDHLGAALDQGTGWIVTHRPIWGLVPIARVGPIGPLEVSINSSEQQAVKGRSLNGVQMIVSGHIHHFSALTFGPARPAQLIVGTGGDVGEPADTPRFYGGKDYLDGMDADTFSFSRYGYYVMDKTGEDWVGAFHDADDIVRANCRLHARALTCTPGAR